MRTGGGVRTPRAGAAGGGVRAGRAPALTSSGRDWGRVLTRPHSPCAAGRVAGCSLGPGSAQLAGRSRRGTRPRLPIFPPPRVSAAPRSRRPLRGELPAAPGSPSALPAPALGRDGRGGQPGVKGRRSPRPLPRGPAWVRPRAPGTRWSRWRARTQIPGGAPRTSPPRAAWPGRGLLRELGGGGGQVSNGKARIERDRGRGFKKLASRKPGGSRRPRLDRSGGELRPEGAEIPETGTEAGAQVTRRQTRGFGTGPGFVERSTLGKNHAVTPDVLSARSRALEGSAQMKGPGA